MPVLTDLDKQNIIKLIQDGKPVPEHYRALLFPDNREYVELTKVYQLVYQGKKRKEDVIADTPTAPLQEVRSFNTDNPNSDDWRNMLIFGDNLMALKSIYEDQRGPNKYGTKNRIKLIYIDPPFATKQDFFKDREKAYRDKIIGAQFIEFLRRRLILLREILADDGSIYVHLDTKKSHYIKAIMDNVFGEENFLNEIIWRRAFGHSDSGRYGIIHDVIFFYGKSENTSWNTILQPADKDYIDTFFDQFDPERGERYQRLSLSAGGLSGGGYNYEYKGVNTLWRCPIETLRKHDEAGRLHWPKKKGGVPRLKKYESEHEGVPIQDIWTDISKIHNQSAELSGYPTQKPEALLERIITASSNPGDIVLDAFAGSGTALAVAEKLGRRWIGMDCGKLAIYTIQKRLLNLTSQVGSVKNDDRDLTERISNLFGIMKSSTGVLVVTEKAKKGEMTINDRFIDALHNIVSTVQDGGTFTLVCPEDKFKATKYEEDTDGRRTIRKDDITYVFSLIEPKQKSEKNKPYKGKTFTLFNAGIYDNSAILDMDWEHYREFVIKLFDVRDEPHKINGFEVDGYIGVDSAWVWNYPEQKSLSMDEEFVASLHKTMNGKAGDRLYVIAPVVSFSFMMDEIRHGGTTYTFLKVPISVLTRLIENKQDGAFRQPISEADVNEVIDAVGFDFISQPVVKWKCLRLEPEGGGLFAHGKKDYVIRLADFRSDTLASSPDDFERFETLSMVLVDYDFDGSVFDLDLVFWAEDLVSSELKRSDSQATGSFTDRAAACKQLDIRIPEDKATDKMMVIFVDKYGNEKKQVLNRKDFK
ncbi:MAG: site-specific DNA-methyltransferase [Desulfuromonadaceae bacterium]